VPFDSAVGGFPYRRLFVPGRDTLLDLQLRPVDGVPTIVIQPSQIVGEEPDGTLKTEQLDYAAIQLVPGLDVVRIPEAGITVGIRGFDQYALLIAKKDPGKMIVWLAFACLIVGIAISFYLPRRRIWARVSPAGDLAIVARSDRYVDVEREFGRLLDDLVALRRPDVAPRRPT
jgi:cytochrome c biogenesis protein ResB